MNNYQLINNNLPVIVKLINNGLVKVDMVKYLEMYENFHSMTGTKGERYKQLSKDFGYHPETVGQAIRKMSKKVK